MTQPSQDIAALARGGRTNILGFGLRLVARLPFLFIAGRLYGPETVGRFALAVVVVEFAALLATLGLKRGLAQAFSSTDRPHSHVAWDGLVVAFLFSIAASAVLFAFPNIMYPNSAVTGYDRMLGLIVVAIAWSDISLAALAYRLNVKATVTARAVVEPWTISIAAWAFFYLTGPRDGLVFAYVLSMLAALTASLIPFIRSYGLPHGWSPHFRTMAELARRNVPLAGADAVEWATRNVDRFILGVLFGPAVVGIYYMAQQVASLPQKLKTSFDPVLGPVITKSLAVGDKAAVARQVRQVGFWIIAAQGALALVFAIPAEAIMGIIGPEFVIGAAALVFLLVAEVLAGVGAVSESALVYMARHRNLMIGLAMLTVQILLSFLLVFAARAAGAPVMVQAAGVAVALMLSLGITSIVRAKFLHRLLGHSVSGWRAPLVGAVLAAGTVGWIATQVPEWAELIVGIPAILATYSWVLYRWAFRDEDRALFRRTAQDDEEPALPADPAVPSALSDGSAARP